MSKIAAPGSEKRPSKSPAPTKKAPGSTYTNQKLSLRQLGLSYGVLTKQPDGPLSKLVAGKKKSTANSKEFSSRRQREKRVGQAEVAYQMGGGPNQEQEAPLEVRQISYDEQTALSPNNQQSSQVNIRFAGKTHHLRPS